MQAIAAIRARLQGRKETPAPDVEAPQPDREHVFLRDGDLQQKIQAEEHKRSTWRHTFKLAYLSLGVIYGDIGTATLYAYALLVVYGPVSLSWLDYGQIPVEEQQQQLKQDILGLFSLLFWTLTMIALLKYSLLLMRASDSGEGGTIALYAHLCRTMGISPFGTMKQQAHQQVLAMKSAASASTASGRFHLTNGVANGPSSAAVEPGGMKSAPGSSAGVLHALSGFLVVDGQRISRFFRGSKAAQRTLLVMAMASVGLAIGDGVIMPVFTVTYAVTLLRGEDVITENGVTGISCAILFVLFLLQHVGTARISATFSPIIMLWLLANAALGIYNLSLYGGYIFNGLNPYWLVKLMTTYADQGSWTMLGGALMCVAGAETMFASVGHFSPSSIALAFGLFAYPCLVLTYLGQGAFMINNPGFDPFWGSIPEKLQWPMFCLAILTSFVASQAPITSAFSLIRQATSLGIFPKLKIIHTDSRIEGRIFIPFVNYMLMVVCIGVLLGFGINGDAVDNLANAYGVAVIGVMLSTTFMLLLTALVHWSISLAIILPVFLFYAAVEGLFAAATMTKVPFGGWIPLLIALLVVCTMLIWWSGSSKQRQTLVASARGINSSLIRVCKAPSGSASRAFGRGHHLVFPSFSHRELAPQFSSPLATLTAEPHAEDSKASPEPVTSHPLLDHGSVALEVSPASAAAGPGQGGPSRQRSAFESPVHAAAAAAAAAAASSAPLSVAAEHLTDYVAIKSRPDKPLARVSGLGLYYGESPVGMPLVMRHFLKNVDAIHEVCIILIVRFLPMPIVRSTERLLVRPVKNMPNFYQVVARYGYQDKVDHGDSFVSKLISTIMFKLEIKAGLKYQSRQEDFIQELESEGEGSSEGSDSEDEPGAAERSGDSARVFGLEVIQESYLGEETKAQEEMAKWEAEQTYSPFISRYALECLSRMRIVAEAPDAAQAAKDALTTAQVLLNAASTRVVHYRARAFTHPGRSAGLLHRLYNATIGVMYSMMESLSFSDSHAWHIPADSTVELGIALEI